MKFNGKHFNIVFSIFKTMLFQVNRKEFMIKILLFDSIFKIDLCDKGTNVRIILLMVINWLCTADNF